MNGILMYTMASTRRATGAAMRSRSLRLSRQLQLHRRSHGERWKASQRGKRVVALS